MILNKRTEIEWTSYLATGIAEGFEESNGIDQILEAWAYLIDTGLCYSLQGWFGRSANNLIEQGIITKDDKGTTIDWDRVDSLNEGGVDDEED